MITIVTEKPFRSIDVIGYGVDSYYDKNQKKIYRVYGIVKPGTRGKLVDRDGSDIKDLYEDETVVVIFRSDKREEAVACKNLIDVHVARGVPAFSVSEFKAWLQNPMPPKNPDPEPKIEGDKNAN